MVVVATELAVWPFCVPLCLKVDLFVWGGWNGGAAG